MRPDTPKPTDSSSGEPLILKPPKYQSIQGQMDAALRMERMEAGMCDDCTWFCYTRKICPPLRAKLEEALKILRSDTIALTQPEGKCDCLTLYNDRKDKVREYAANLIEEVLS